jgi:hypothetical protein
MPEEQYLLIMVVLVEAVQGLLGAALLHLYPTVTAVVVFRLLLTGLPQPEPEVAGVRRIMAPPVQVVLAAAARGNTTVVTLGLLIRAAVVVVVTTSAAAQVALAL